MTYAVGGLIQATDFNDFCCTIGSGLNDAWSTGTGDSGYGQAAFSTVVVGDTIFARPATQVSGGPGTTPTWSTTPEWRTLVDTVNAMHQHQIGGAAPLSAASFPASGSLPLSTTALLGLIAHAAAMGTTTTLVRGTQRLSAAAVGITTTSTAILANSWQLEAGGNIGGGFPISTNAATLTVGTTVDNARYWFNAGGTLRLTLSDAANPAINALCTAMGTLVYTSSNNTKTIAGVTYPGGLCTSTGVAVAANGFNNGGVSTYTATSGTITLTVTFTPAGNTVTVNLQLRDTSTTVYNPGLTLTVDAVAPSTTYLQNTWGTTTTTASISAYCPQPVVPQIIPNALTVGTPFVGTITVTNATTASVVSGLPAWLTQSGAVSGANYVITLSGTPTDVALYDIRVDATNACGGASRTVTNQPAGPIQAAGANCPTPVITISSNSFTVGTAYAGTVNIANWTAAGPVPIISGLPTGISATWNAGASRFDLSGTPTVGFEPYNISVSATNDCTSTNPGFTPTSATQGFPGTVGATGCAAPAITSTITPNTASVGVAYTGTINISNATTATVTSALPAGLTASGAASGLDWVITISGTPTASGPFAITIDATNACATGLPTTSTGMNGGTLTVAPAGACPAPTVGTIAPASATEGVAYTGSVTVAPIGTAAPPSLSGLPTGLTATWNAGLGRFDITGTPGAGTSAASPFAITVTATNDCGAPSTPTTVTGVSAGGLSVAPPGACPAPVVGTVSPATSVEGVAYTGTLTVSNITLGSPTPTLSGLPAGLTATWNQPSGQFDITGTPNAGESASSPFAILVTATNDCGGGNTPTTVTNVTGGSLSVSPPGACPAPVVGGIIGGGATENVAYTGSISVTPATITPIVPQIVGLPASITATWNQALQQFDLTGTPVVGDAASSPYPVFITATNDCGGGNTPTTVTAVSAGNFTVAAAGACSPPTAGTISPTGVTENSPYSGTFVINAPVTSLANATISGPGSAGLSVTINGTNVDITGTPTSTGTFSVSVDATNACGGGLTTTTVNLTSATLTVGPAGSCATPNAGTITPVTGAVLSPYNGTFNVNDATSLTSATLSGAGAAGLTATISGTSVNITGTPTTAGTFTVDVVADNVCGGGNTSVIGAAVSSTTVTIAAAPACPAPVVNAITPSTTTGDGATAYSGTITIQNATGGSITGGLPAWASQSGAASGSDWIITVTGTPAVADAGVNNIVVDATNACSPTSTTTNVTGASGGSLTVSANACPTPVAGAITPTSGQQNQVYGPGTFTVTNATSLSNATISGPGSAGLSVSIAGTTVNITGTPTVVGNFTVSVDATNACGTGTTSTATVTSANVPISPAGLCPSPTAGTILPATGTALSSYNGTFTINNATSLSGASLSGPGAAGLTATISGTDVNITGTPTTAGTFTVSVTADNVCGGGNTPVTGVALTSDTVTIAAAPSCPTPAAGTITPTTGTVLSPYSGTFSVTNASSLTSATLSGAGAAGLTATISGTSVNITGTPTTAGTFTVDVVADNSCGPGNVPVIGAAVSSAAVTIAAAPVCTTPTVNAITPATFTATGAAVYTGTITIQNATGGSITSALPTWASQSGAASGANWVITVTGTPGVGAAATTNFTVDATNACGATSVTSSVTGQSGGSLTVSVNACPAPVVNSITPATFTATGAAVYTGTITIQDATGGSITSALPAWASQSGAASGANWVITVTGTPGLSDAATTNFTVDATNACGTGTTTNTTGSSGGSLVVSVGACPNPAPIEGLTPATATVGVPYTGTFKVTAGTATAVNITTNFPAWATQSFNAATGVWTMTGTPTAAAGGSFSMDGTATNNCGTGTPGTLTGNIGTLTVNCPAPTVTATLSSTTVTAGTPFNATITLSNATTATISNKPAWMSESFAAGVLTLSGTPGAGDVTAGLALLVNATNSCGATAATATGLAGGTVVVNSAAACLTPVLGTGLSPTTVTINNAYNGTFTVNNATSVTAVSGLPAGVTSSTSGSNPVTVTLSGTPTASGTFNITFDATNACGGASSTSTASSVSAGTLTVNTVTCTTPVIGPLFNNTFTNGTAYTGSITISNSTAAGTTISGLPTGITSTITQSGNNVVINLTGTPTVGGQAYTISVSTTNTTIPASCAPSASASNTETGTVGSGFPLYTGDCCGSAATQTEGYTPGDLRPTALGGYPLCAIVQTNQPAAAILIFSPYGFDYNGAATCEYPGWIFLDATQTYIVAGGHGSTAASADCGPVFVCP